MLKLTIGECLKRCHVTISSKSVRVRFDMECFEQLGTCSYLVYLQLSISHLLTTLLRPLVKLSLSLASDQYLHLSLQFSNSSAVASLSISMHVHSIQLQCALCSVLINLARVSNPCMFWRSYDNMFKKKITVGNEDLNMTVQVEL